MLTHLNYPIDLKYLNKKFNSSTFINLKYFSFSIKNLYISKINSDPYINMILKDLNLIGSPRFLKIQANTSLFPHIDNKTKCSINFLLDDYNDPIVFGLFLPYKKFFYKSAIIDTTKFHSVRATNYDRKIFKISIFQESYLDICKKLNRFIIPDRPVSSVG